MCSNKVISVTVQHKVNKENNPTAPSLEKHHWCLICCMVFGKPSYWKWLKGFFFCVFVLVSAQPIRDQLFQGDKSHANMQVLISPDLINKIVAWFLEQLTLSPEPSAQHGCSLRFINFDYWRKIMAASNNYFLKRRIQTEDTLVCYILVDLTKWN